MDKATTALRHALATRDRLRPQLEVAEAEVASKLVELRQAQGLLYHFQKLELPPVTPATTPLALEDGSPGTPPPAAPKVGGAPPSRRRG